MSFECFYCAKHFSAKQRVKVHIMNQVCLKRPHQCWCGKSCTSARALRLHTYKQHGDDIQRIRKQRHKELKTIPLTFNDLSEFSSWKESVEEETATKFVKPRGSKVLRDGTRKTLYVCHRSGNVRVMTDHRKRAPPKKGSCKINDFCPAFISIEEHLDGTIRAEFHGTHSNHEHEVEHLSLTRATKEKIAEDLKRGATFEEILDDIHSNFSHGECNTPQRVQILTRKDLHNIMQEYKIAFKQGQANDATNVISLVQECNERFGENSPIKLFKPRNVDCSDQVEGANLEDFILVILTPTQKQMLVQSEHTRICVDSTHGSRGHDFHLTTVSSIFNSALNMPLAYCISSIVNENIMCIFFSILIGECSQIHAPVFITEDYPMYINAWCKTIGVPKKWQVDKNLPDNLQKLNGSVEPENDLDLKLRSIMRELDEQVLVILLKKLVVNKLLNNESTQSFGQYFEEEFTRRPSNLLYDYRRHVEIHANVKLEAVYRVLKDIYYKGMKVRRPDFGILRLLKLCWEDLFKKLTNVDKENEVYILKVVKDRHTSALSIPPDRIVQKGESYEFICGNDHNRIYFVEKQNIDCWCQLRCTECDICIHDYTCTCVDYHIMGNFCKHVHATNILEKKICSNMSDEYKNTIKIGDEVMNPFENIRIPNLENQTTHTKEKLIDTLLHLTHLLQTNTYESREYEEGAKLFQNALNIFYKTKPLNLERNEMLNKVAERKHSSFPRKVEKFDESEVINEELMQHHIEVDDVNLLIDGVEEIVYVDVYTTNDEYV